MTLCYREAKIILKTTVAQLDRQKDKVNQPAQPLQRDKKCWWHVFRFNMTHTRTQTPYKKKHLFHRVSFPPYQQADVVLILPWGFLFTVRWLTQRAGRESSRNFTQQPSICH